MSSTITVKLLLACCVLSASSSAFSDDQLASEVLALFKKSCGKCHGGAKPVAGLSLVDLPSLRNRSELFDFDAPELSKLYDVIVTGDMPQGGEPLPQSESDLVLAWIKAGAPALSTDRAEFSSDLRKKFLAGMDEGGKIRSLDLAVYAEIFEDLRFIPSKQLHDVRYLSLNHLVEAGEGEEQLQGYRDGLLKLMNSLSWEKLAGIVAIDKDKSIFRIVLSDFGWTASDWQKVVAAAQYHPKRDELVVEAVQDAIGTKDTPLMRADSFAALVASPELYHELLKLPKTRQELLAKLQIEAGELIRAGFQHSNISKNRNNRIVERQNTKYGAYWESYDFRTSLNKENIFDNPLRASDTTNTLYLFDHAGGEIIFNLPNGLQGYMLVNKNGDRIDKAPTDVVQDASREDVQIINGISCMGCHDRGIKQKIDDLREDALARKFFPDEIKKVIAKVYAEQGVLKDRFDTDEKRFVSALSRLGVDSRAGRPEPIRSLVRRYERPVNLVSAAAEFGLTVKEFEQLATDQSLADTDLLQTLYRRVKRAGVPREIFQSMYLHVYNSITKATAAQDDQLGQIHPSFNGISKSFVKVLLANGKVLTGAVVGPRTVMAFSEDPTEAQYVVEGESKKPIVETFGQAGLQVLVLDTPLDEVPVNVDIGRIVEEKFLFVDLLAKSIGFVSSGGVIVSDNPSIKGYISFTSHSSPIPGTPLVDRAVHNLKGFTRRSGHALALYHFRNFIIYTSKTNHLPICGLNGLSCGVSSAVSRNGAPESIRETSEWSELSRSVVLVKSRFWPKYQRNGVAVGPKTVLLFDDNEPEGLFIMEGEKQTQIQAIYRADRFQVLVAEHNLERPFIPVAGTERDSGNNYFMDLVKKSYGNIILDHAHWDRRLRRSVPIASSVPLRGGVPIINPKVGLLGFTSFEDEKSANYISEFRPFLTKLAEEAHLSILGINADAG